MSSSSSSNSMPMLKAKRSGGGLQGPRPQPLSLPTASSASPARPSKKPRVSDGGSDVAGVPGPVIIYEHTPKAVNVRPEEFMAVVQRLTGQQQSGGHLHAVLPAQTDETSPVMPSLPKGETPTAATNHLVLALGQQEAAPQLDYFPVLPSPGPASDGGFLLSPGIFLFSPATMQAIHEMIS